MLKKKLFLLIILLSCAFLWLLSSYYLEPTEGLVYEKVDGGYEVSDYV